MKRKPKFSLPEELQSRIISLSGKVTQHDRETVQSIMISVTASLLDMMKPGMTYRALLFSVFDLAFKHGIPVPGGGPKKLRAIIKKAEAAQRKRERETKRLMNRTMRQMVGSLRSGPTWIPTSAASTTTTTL